MIKKNNIKITSLPALKFIFKVLWNHELRKPYHPKNSDYKTGFEELSVPYNVV